MTSTFNITIPVSTTPEGQQFAVFIPGIDAFTDTKLRGTATLKDPNDDTVEVTIRQKRFGSLVDMLSQYGPQSYSTYGYPYDIGLIIDDIEMMHPDAENVGDVRSIYTVLLMDRPITPPPTEIN